MCRQGMLLAHTVLVKECSWPTQYWSINAIGPHSLDPWMLLAHTVLVKECYWPTQSWPRNAIGSHSLGQRMLLARTVLVKACYWSTQSWSKNAIGPQSLCLITLLVHRNWLILRYYFLQMEWRRFVGWEGSLGPGRCNSCKITKSRLQSSLKVPDFHFLYSAVHEMISFLPYFRSFALTFYLMASLKAGWNAKK